MSNQKDYSGTIGWLRNTFFKNNSRTIATIGSLAGLVGVGTIVINEVKQPKTYQTEVSKLEHTINAPFNTHQQIDYNEDRLTVLRYLPSSHIGGTTDGYLWRDEYLLIEKAVTSNLETIAKFTLSRRTYLEKHNSKEIEPILNYTKIEFESERGKITATDYGNDGIFDLIKIQPEPRRGYIEWRTGKVYHEDISFYRGEGYLKNLIASGLEQKGKEIPEHFGIVKLDYNTWKDVFTADNSSSIRSMFENKDTFYYKISDGAKPIPSALKEYLLIAL